MSEQDSNIQKIAGTVIDLSDIIGENNTLRIIKNSPEVFHSGLSKAMRQKDLTSFAQEVFKLKGRKTKRKFFSNFEENLKELKALLRTSPSLKESQKGELVALLRWDDLNWEEYLNKLKLSDFQLEILKAVLSSKKPVSLHHIKDFLKEKKISASNGSQIGGSLAGITKKCLSYSIPLVVLKIEDHLGKDAYTLSPKLATNLEKFITKTSNKDCL